jgi:hypothetical protein
MKHKTDACGCCEGIEKLAPLPIVNRPGLTQLLYRVGTHATFLETMLARLSNLCIGSEDDCKEGKGRYPLQALKTREGSDPSIALLDAWATVADVLTFYQERIANEGYLRTATERRSVLELARLVGYNIRPGVSSSVFLAYTIDENCKDEVVIPKGARAQSVPGPGELPQSFEISEDLKARCAWNNLRPRMTRPQFVRPETDTIYLKGIDTRLKPNDPLVVIDSLRGRHFRRVLRVEIDAEFKRTKVVLTIKGEIDLEVSELDALIHPNLIPEEEGPYSRVIGDATTSKLREDIARLVQRLKDATELVRDLKHAVHEQIPRLEQTIRIFKALNFDLLAGWAGAVLGQINAIGKKLELRMDSAEPSPSLPPIIDLEEVKKIGTELLDETERKPVAKEIVTTEIKKIIEENGMIEQLESVVNDTRKKADEKVLAIKSDILCVQQLMDVFNELSFEKQAAWASDLSEKLVNSIENQAVVIRRIESGKASVSFQPAPALTILSRALLVKPEPFKRTSLLLLRSGQELKRPVDVIYAKQSSIGSRFVSILGSIPPEVLHHAQENVVVPPGPAKVYALRVTASLFGHNAQRQVNYKNGGVPDLPSSWPEWPTAGDEGNNVVFLDRAYEDIMSGSYAVIQQSNGSPAQIFSNIEVSVQPRSEYGLNSKTTKLKLQSNWRNDALDISFLRGTAVYAQSELLDLDEEPVTDEVKGNEIELNALYEGLNSGRWLIVGGDRTDIPGTRGVRDSERAMILGVSESVQKVSPKGEEIDLPGDRLHTTLRLANNLTYTYKRDTVTIYGNVVKATHGETRKEVLGSGDGAKTLQSFVLKQPPLTFVSAPNPFGVDSTLKVYVNDVEWHEMDSLAGLSQTNWSFITKTDDEGKTTVIFGNGREGARVPTGIENIKAEYRNGIGKTGNVKAGQISLLMTRPLGVKEVINPLSASGGSDKEDRDQARRSAPLAVTALDRLVSVRDYADFALTFAGIGKASATELSDARRQIVHVTIAGADDIPIDKTSDLYKNLFRALRLYGDPYQPFQLDLRELMLLVIKAKIRILPDYQWVSVEPKIRDALLTAFSFERRELGQDALMSEAMKTIQNIAGVTYADIDLFESVSETEANDADGLKDKLDSLATSEGRTKSRIVVKAAEATADGIRPSQIAFLTPKIPDTLILEELAQ